MPHWSGWVTSPSPEPWARSLPFPRVFTLSSAFCADQWGLPVRTSGPRTPRPVSVSGGRCRRSLWEKTDETGGTPRGCLPRACPQADCELLASQEGPPYLQWQVAYVISDSLQCQGLQPARLLCPWKSPGKNTGVGCTSFPRGSSWPRVEPVSLASPALAGGFFTASATRGRPPIWLS